MECCSICLEVDRTAPVKTTTIATSVTTMITTATSGNWQMLACLHWVILMIIHSFYIVSVDMRKLLVPWTHNKLGDKSFSAAGPRSWSNPDYGGQDCLSTPSDDLWNLIYLTTVAFSDSLTRVVLPSLRHLSASERLSYLHWLPVYYQQFKIAIYTYKTLATCQPSSLQSPPTTPAIMSSPFFNPAAIPNTLYVYWFW